MLTICLGESKIRKCVIIKAGLKELFKAMRFIQFNSILSFLINIKTPIKIQYSNNQLSNKIMSRGLPKAHK